MFIALHIVGQAVFFPLFIVLARSWNYQVRQRFSDGLFQKITFLVV